MPDRAAAPAGAIFLDRLDHPAGGLGIPERDEHSDELARAQRDINALFRSLDAPTPFAEDADYEAVVELNYRAQMTAWWSLQTSLQRVLHPGGRVFQDTPNAWVLVVQTMFRF